MGSGVNERYGGPSRTSLYIICYVLWLAFSALTVWTMLLVRDGLLGLLPVIGPWMMGAVDKFGILMMALVALVWILFLEDYLRSGVRENQFWLRVRRIALIQIIVVAVAFAFKNLEFPITP